MSSERRIGIPAPYDVDNCRHTGTNIFTDI
jgi:hypothetical protein